MLYKKNVILERRKVKNILDSWLKMFLKWPKLLVYVVCNSNMLKYLSNSQTCAAKYFKNVKCQTQKHPHTKIDRQTESIEHVERKKKYFTSEKLKRWKQM